MEARAITAVFGKGLPAVSSTKPVTGHTLGAAGALELGLCWMSLAEGRGLPPHLWDGEYDPEMPRLVFAAPDTGLKSPAVCMSNSFAFGGCNVSLILGRIDYEDRS
jgi:3-oxoacyl-[acyl-carrier-protein] synthase-1